MTWHEAMRRYGSDKPDLRFGLELVELTSHFATTEFRVFQAPYVGAVVMPGGASQTRKELDGWQDWAKARGARGLAYVVVGPDGELGGPVAKNLTDAERAGLAGRARAAPGDCSFFAAGRGPAGQASATPAPRCLWGRPSARGTRRLAWRRPASAGPHTAAGPGALGGKADGVPRPTGSRGA
jgi:aspartyl-tRNA synthetase